MKYNIPQRKVTNYGTLETIDVSVLTNAKSFRIIVGSMYSDIKVAVIREIFTNAWDAQKEKGNLDVPIEIHYPTEWEPYYSVRDYGNSMDHDTIKNVYAQIYNSTKDDNNDSAGMYGMGSKTPLGYRDNFSVICYQDGMMRYYEVYLNDSGMPKIDLKAHAPTEEKDGVLIQVAVNSEDIKSFKEKTIEFVKNSNAKIILNGKPFDIKREVLLSNDNWQVIRSEQQSYYKRIRTYVRMGCIMYECAEANIGHIPLNVRGSVDIILDVPIGSIDITPSRDTIIYNNKTNETLKKTVKAFSEDLMQVIREKINKCKTIQDILRFNDDIINCNSLPKHTISDVQNMTRKYLYDRYSKYVIKEYDHGYHWLRVVQAGNVIDLAKRKNKTTIVLYSSKNTTYVDYREVCKNIVDKNPGFRILVIKDLRDNTFHMRFLKSLFNDFNFINIGDVKLKSKLPQSRAKFSVKRFTQVSFSSSRYRNNPWLLTEYDPKKFWDVYIPTSGAIGFLEWSRGDKLVNSLLPEGKHIAILPPTKVAKIEKDYKIKLTPFKDYVSILANNVTEEEMKLYNFAKFKASVNHLPQEILERIFKVKELNPKKFEFISRCINLRIIKENKDHTFACSDVYKKYPLLQYVSYNRFDSNKTDYTTALIDYIERIDNDSNNGN